MNGSPFLMYHRVGPALDRADVYTVPEASFRAQLEHLHRAGYDVTSVGAALAAAPAGRPRVVLTFDDGCSSDLAVAAPFLAHYGFGATFYIVPGFLGRAGSLTESQVAELAGMGFEVGSHSLTHAYLSDLDDIALRTEVLESRRRLEEILGGRVRHFSCPGGRHTSRVTAAVQAAGYESLATSEAGLNRYGGDRFRLCRLDIQRGTSLDEFARLCRGRGLAERRLRQVALGAAKTLLGNGRYDRMRNALLTGVRGAR